ncbi:hypothetical protein AWC05_10295 [Mycobacterium florentinum]|uniref:Uncharacterized protein n=1 Tax=Mycobacterium florentinum TaxID=292462 RepID=A0A1X1UIG5_MYCFL|nr:hypothetical protein [Mycobacterium florentinum]MCV7409422.1 hypothetical protein [Mycobacterium florentinum]ORV56587.1 hypothetical protein AWC05_10295 [Mycobacterium florentinum]BBX78380.1 hypothetical protein MFLOJ_21670 [Mycobacterium florentinum]
MRSRVEDLFALQSDWLAGMALVCRQMSQRVVAIVDAHKVAVDKQVPGGKELAGNDAHAAADPVALRGAVDDWLYWKHLAGLLDAARSVTS